MSEQSPLSYEGRCILCGGPLAVTQAEAHRERALCPNCGINARLRGLLLAAVRELVCPPAAPLRALAPCRQRRVLGISDHDTCAAALRDAFDYTNTQFHAAPFLDICDPASVAAFRDYDAVLCSDVIEHTIAPPEVTLPNLLSMLRPGGVLLLSAPTFHVPATIEWYGGLVEHTVARVEDRFEVHWRDIRGQDLIDRRPTFHGGPGAVLEMRVIAHSHLLDVARRHAHSADILEFVPEWGYSWRFFREQPYIDGPGDGRVIVVRR